MNQIMRCVALSMMVFVGACMQPEPSESTEQLSSPLEESAAAKDDGNGALANTCNQNNGKPCDTVGQTFRCSHGPGEPGICQCLPSHVLECG
jgi:hypothetical protein